MNKVHLEKLNKLTEIALAVFAGFLIGDKIVYPVLAKSSAQEVRVIEQVKPDLELKINQVLIPDTDNNFLNDSETILLARLVYGEARGESYDTKVAIAQTVLNRVKENKWYGKNLHEVILKPKQFSCFNSNDPNLKKLQDPLKYEKPEIWQECYDVAKKVLNKEVEDASQGANHYCTNNPSWAKDKQPLFTNGKTKFYKLEN